MKKKEFSSLGKKLLAYLPGFKVDDDLIFAEPIGNILRGIGFDSSSHNPKSFYMHVFFQPLCVPKQHVFYTLGFRLRDMKNYDNWYSDRPDLVRDIGEALTAKALPFLRSVATVEGAAQAADAMASTNPHIREAAAFCWALSDDRKTALSRFDKLYNWLNETIDRNIGWQMEQLDRVEYVRELLRSDPHAARKRLLAWEAENVQRIGLESLWSPTRV